MSVILSGIQQFTMLDFPERVACIAFIPGCHFRCKYCHNPEFVLPEKIKEIKCSFVDEEVFFNFLDKRKNVLDGVVVSGGEPTVMRSLPDFIRKIKFLGFQVKLDTNGSNPQMIQELLDEGLLDYIAMDVKTTLKEYSDLAGDKVKPEAVAECIRIVKNSGIEYEFRTTLIKEVHSEKVLQGIAALVVGAKNMYLQLFRPEHTLDPSFESCHAFSVDEMQHIADTIFAPRVDHVGVRS